MNRRNFLKNSSLAGIAVTSLGVAACDGSKKEKAVESVSEIFSDDFILHEATVDDLQQKMKDGSFTSRSITELYLKRIDALDKKDIRFAVSNITHYNGNKNSLLIKWMKKYRVHKIKSNYINYHNNKQKKINEVLIANY